MMKLEKPYRWKFLPLAEQLEFITGGDWGKDETFIDENYDFAYCIRGSEIKNWDKEKGQSASLRKIKKSSIISRKLHEGDILVEISGGGPEQPVGRTVLIDKTVLNYKPDIPKICTNFLRLIRPFKEIDSCYLNYFLKLFYHSGEITKFQAGSNNLRNLKFPDFLKIEIPIPSLAEQQAIVAKIEALLSELDNGKQQLLTAQQQLKVYRQSLLKWAFEGKLTNKNVKEGELPEGWKMVKVGDVCNCIVPNRDKPKTFSGNIKWVTTPNLSETSIQLNYDELILGLSETEVHQYNARVIPTGGVIMTCVGTFGLSAVVDRPIVINQQLHAFISNEQVNAKYLAYCIQSSKQYFERTSTSTTIQYLNKSNCNSMPLPLPFYKEQQLIVDELESKLTECDKIEETISQSLQQAETLRQSVLKMAFEGRLV